LDPRIPRHARRLGGVLQDAPERRRMGVAARQAVYRKFRDDAIAINEIYDTLLHGAKEKFRHE
jgi:hypothetical protein